MAARLAVVSQWASARSSHAPGGPGQSNSGVLSSDMPVYISMGRAPSAGGGSSRTSRPSQARQRTVDGGVVGGHLGAVGQA